jgi:enoyl-CoA hydratase/carnithine racemase
MHEGIARISLNRPERLNAYSMAMRDEFSEALSLISIDADIRCLIITGEGRAFCSGADLTEFGTAPSQVISRYVRWKRDLWSQMLSIPKPIISSIHGYCIGSGLEIALLSDIRIASSDTIFAMPETSLGMIPAAGGTQTLPSKAGTSRALELLLSGRPFTAETALNYRIITRLVNPDQLNLETYHLAKQWTCINPDKVRALKLCIKASQDLSTVDSLAVAQRLAMIGF